MEDSRIVELYWQKNADAIKETDSKYGACVLCGREQMCVSIGNIDALVSNAVCDGNCRESHID